MSENVHQIHTDKKTGMLLTLCLCFCVALLEGFDIQSMGVAGPFVRKEFGLSPKELGLIFSAATLGMLPGAIIAGRLADKYGRKLILLVSVLVFGLMSLATAYCTDLTSFAIVRFLTGLGMGGALPLMIAIASESVPKAWNGTAVSVMYAGVPVGAAITALMASSFADPSHWRHIFYLGGIAPIAILPILALFIKETSHAKDVMIEVAEKISFKNTLFGEGRWLATLQLWVSFFCTLIVLYFILNWLPILVTDNGLSRPQVGQVQLFYQVGAAIGVLTLGWLLDKVNIKWVAIAMYAGILSGLGALAIAGTATTMMLSAALCGFFLTGGQSVLYAMAALVYPANIRGTGVGSAVAAGRVGAFVGPMLAGMIMAMSSGSSTVIMASIPVIIVGTIATLGLTIYLARQEKAQQV